MGAKPTPAPPYTLRGSGGRTFSRSQELDSPEIRLLLACGRAEFRVQGQVRSRSAKDGTQEEVDFFRFHRPTCKPETLRRFCRFTLPATVGCIRQASVRGAHPGSPLSGPGYASRRHHQSPLIGLRWRAGYLPLERLRAWQQAAQDDPCSDGDSAPLYPAHSTARLRPHPAVRNPLPYPAICVTGTCPTASRRCSEP